MFVGGDFNKRDVSKAVADFPLIKTVITPPTRGKNVLNLLATDALPS